MAFGAGERRCIRNSSDIELSFGNPLGVDAGVVLVCFWGLAVGVGSDKWKR